VRRLALLVLAALVATASAKPHDSSGLVIGEFALTKVVDGDTIRVDGLDSSLRLLGIDTEETFKHASERRAFDAGWEQYEKDVRGTSPRPVKFATPMGMEAKDWAEKFFAGADKVRLERDDPKQIRDRYNRYLAYVFVQKNGVWVNYNVEAVRAGMAPYFPKYGRSRRFHDEFVKAEAEAKAAKRGIWDPTKMAYPDYAEREAWWTARGDFVAAFDKDAENHVSLDDSDATERLEHLVGKPVVVLGTVNEIYGGHPTRVMLDHLPVIFFDKDVLAQTGIAAWKGEWVVVTGTPSLYKHKVQIVIDRAAQIQMSDVPGLKRPDAAAP
jgi:endonuclease YncB( thermonuclease family)